MDLRVMTMELSFILEVMVIRVATLPEFLKEGLESTMTPKEVKELEKLL